MNQFTNCPSDTRFGKSKDIENLQVRLKRKLPKEIGKWLGVDRAAADIVNVPKPLDPPLPSTFDNLPLQTWSWSLGQWHTMLTQQQVGFIKTIADKYVTALSTIALTCGMEHPPNDHDGADLQKRPLGNAILPDILVHSLDAISQIASNMASARPRGLAQALLETTSLISKLQTVTLGVAQALAKSEPTVLKPLVDEEALADVIDELTGFKAKARDFGSANNIKNAIDLFGGSD